MKLEIPEPQHWENLSFMEGEETTINCCFAGIFCLSFRKHTQMFHISR